MGQIPDQIHKTSMKSTWRQTGKGWEAPHWVMEIVRLHPTDLKNKPTVHAKTDKMGYLPELHAHIWVILHAIWPMIIHQAFIWVFGGNLNVPAAFVWYTIAYNLNAVHQLWLLRDLGTKYGFLDGDKHERDQVPDASVRKVLDSLTATSTYRPLFTVILAYRTSQAPLTISPWVIVEVGVYGLVLDFFFYWYHRCMHEFDGLWKFHRTHHLTKHPTPLLSLYADWEQEVFDVAIVPLLTYATMKAMGFPMGFYDWWICHQYIVFTELWGHGGVRLWVTPPSTNSWFLNLVGAELCTEDHDLHHRQGWRNSANYGKQTRFWDKLFGTCGKRIESVEGVIDWNQPVYPKWI
jgi:sterol desaturase/sphingolipid hydroxylase (fatty acid hydroxylase superfamily)